MKVRKITPSGLHEAPTPNVRGEKIDATRFPAFIREGRSLIENLDFTIQTALKKGFDVLAIVMHPNKYDELLKQLNIEPWSLEKPKTYYGANIEKDWREMEFHFRVRKGS